LESTSGHQHNEIKELREALTDMNHESKGLKEMELSFQDAAQKGFEQLRVSSEESVRNAQVRLAQAIAAERAAEQKCVKVENKHTVSMLAESANLRHQQEHALAEQDAARIFHRQSRYFMHMEAQLRDEVIQAELKFDRAEHAAQELDQAKNTESQVLQSRLQNMQKDTHADSVKLRTELVELRDTHMSANQQERAVQKDLATERLMYTQAERCLAQSTVQVQRSTDAERSAEEKLAFALSSSDEGVRRLHSAHQQDIASARSKIGQLERERLDANVSKDHSQARVQILTDELTASATEKRRLEGALQSEQAVAARMVPPKLNTYCHECGVATKPYACGVCRALCCAEHFVHADRRCNVCDGKYQKEAQERAEHETKRCQENIRIAELAAQKRDRQLEAEYRARMTEMQQRYDEQMRVLEEEREAINRRATQPATSSGGDRQPPNPSWSDIQRLIGSELKENERKSQATAQRVKEENDKRLMKENRKPQPNG